MQLQDLLIHSSVLFTASSTAYYYYYKLQSIAFLLYIVVSSSTYLAVFYMIPKIKKFTLNAGLYGKDINKKGTPEGEAQIPETLGIVPATIFIIFNMVGVLYSYKQHTTSHIAFEHCAGMLSICFIIFLGFCDDVFDLPWRYKMILPNLASLPILVAYEGVTHVVVPIFVRPYFGNYVNLGILYYLYMMAVVTFCTNSINIYAGINGLEVTQSIIIACSILLYNLTELWLGEQQKFSHTISIQIILPYIFCTLGLYYYNKYPSQVFVGDTFCYWSGMVFATVGILGHFSKTLLLFFIPQILNFVYSLPQLMKIRPCPRHRLPYYNVETKKLEKIKTNLNLINLYLWIRGPLSEKDLCKELVVLQIACSFLGFFIRYYGAHLMF
ncbi:hypothetical protein ABPG72_012239 [Tetrahymena utriculariae]